MDPRFVTKTMHAYLDYPVAISLMVAPFALGLGRSNPMAVWLAATTGVAALLLTLLTDHPFGVLRLIPYSVHLAVDAVVGIVFLLAPIALGFSGMDAAYYWANSVAVLFVVGMHRPESSPAVAACV